MNSNSKTVFIPIEMAHRELDGKLLLATELCDRGYTVKIGSKANIFNYLSISTGGILLSIWSAHKKFAKTYARIKKSKIKILAMDEESIVTMGDSIYATTRLSHETLNELDVYLAFSERDKRLVDRLKSASIKVESVGNPRLDVLAYMQKNVTSNQQNNVLFVSPFGFGNHYLGFTKYMSQLSCSGVIPNEYIQHYYNYGCNQLSNMNKFYELVELCVKDGPKNLNYIYRPHPAENVDAISKSLGHLDITIVQDTSLINDLLNSRLVIHNFCTVGIEAKILGIPTLGYSPVSYDISDEDLVYKDAPFASNPVEALSHIIQLTSSPYPNKINLTQFNNFFSSEKSYQKIANCIDSLSCFKHTIILSPKIILFLKKRLLLLYTNIRSNYHSHRVKLLTIQNIINRLNFFKIPTSYKISTSIFTGLITIRPL